MNDGPPVDGVTGPLAALPGLAASLLGGDAVTAAKAVGLSASALAAALVVRAASRRASGALGGWLAVLLVGVGPTLGVWGVGGLETGLATLCFTLAALGTIRRPAPSFAVVGASIAALAWLRPELALASGALLAGLVLRSRRGGAVAVGVALAGAISVVVFRVALFGHPLPLAVAAKPPELENGALYVARVVAITGSGVAVALVLAAIARGRRGDRILAAAVLAHFVALVVAGGDWMPGFRLAAPVLPTIALVAATTASRFRPKRMRAWAGIGLVAVACVVPALDLVVELPEVRAAGDARDTHGRELARWLAVRARTVALVDVGFLARASGVEVVDLGGLTDPVVALAPGGHLSKHIDAGYLASRDPDALVLHAAVAPRVDAEGRLVTLVGYPVERRVASMPWVRARFRVARVVRYAPDYFYVVLTVPRELGQAPPGSGAARAHPPSCRRCGR